MAGLRERNRARTMAEIRQHALRLFYEQGYTATTMAQVARAAEVSESTLFRYFPSKEDLAFQDMYDDLIIGALRRQPADLSPIGAIRAAFRTGIESLPPDLLAQEERHQWLIFATPELHAGQIREMLTAAQLLDREIAARTGRDPGDFEVRNLTAAVLGVIISALMTASRNPSLRYLDLLDEGLTHLERGLPL